MIDKEKVREAKENLMLLCNPDKKVCIDGSNKDRRLIQVSVDVFDYLAELYIVEKLVEPMSKEEIEKIISETNIFILPNERKKLSEALVKKMGGDAG